MQIKASLFLLLATWISLTNEIGTRSIKDQLASKAVLKRKAQQPNWGKYILCSSTMPNITCACILVVILPRRPTTLASFPRAAWHSSSHHQDTVSMWRGIPHVWLRFESVQAVWLRHSIYTSSKIGGHTADIMLECDYFGDIFSQLPPQVCPANFAFTEGSFPSLLTATVIQTLVEFQGHCWVPASCNEVFEKLDFSCTNGYELLASALCVYLLSAYPNSFCCWFWRFYISHDKQCFKSLIAFRVFSQMRPVVIIISSIA